MLMQGDTGRGWQKGMLQHFIGSWGPHVGGGPQGGHIGGIQPMFYVLLENFLQIVPNRMIVGQKQEPWLGLHIFISTGKPTRLFIIKNQAVVVLSSWLKIEKQDNR